MGALCICGHCCDGNCNVVASAAMHRVHFSVASTLSAVDMQDLPCDVACAFEVQHGIDDIAHFAHPSHRMQLGQEFMRFRSMHRRLDHAGRHRVHADACACKFDCE